MLKNAYIAGLFEGDGHITMIKNKNPRFCITTHEKNEPWLLKIKEHFQDYGFIRRKRKERALVLTISNKKGLYLIAKSLNGHLKTPKIEIFNKLIDWLNENYLFELNPNFKLKHKKINFDFNNAWLSGFIEADGGFYIRYSIPKISSKKLPRIGARLSIDQRMFSKTNKTYKLIMQAIAQYLDSKLYIVTKANGNSYYHLTVNSKNSTKKLIKYLEKYPLSSSKYLDYINWKQVVFLIKEKEHLKEENLENIRYLKQQMNNSRTKFVWKHLT